MCCFLTALFLVGPRLAILVWYLFQPVYVNAAFDNFIWGFLGWLFPTLVDAHVYRHISRRNFGL